MNHKSGFTLVELLAVIVILAIILAISIPGISNVLNNSTKDAFISSTKLFLKNIEYKLMEDESLDLNIVTPPDLGLSDQEYEIISITKAANQLYIVLSGKNKFQGLTSCGTSHNIRLGTIQQCLGEGTLINPGDSCKHILDEGNSFGDGVYYIGANYLPVYCDMTTYGGGWTKLDANLAPILSVPKGSAEWVGDTLKVGIQETECSTNTRQYNLTSPSFDYTEAFVLFQRVNTIGQCSAIGGMNYSGWYNGPEFEGASYSRGMCTWGDGIWANTCCGAQNMNGLKLYWIMKASSSNRFSLFYNTHCAGGTGIGYHQWFVR